MSGGLASETGSPDEASSQEAQPFDTSVFDTSVAHSARVYDYWLGRNLQIF